MNNKIYSDSDYIQLSLLELNEFDIIIDQDITSSDITDANILLFGVKIVDVDGNANYEDFCSRNNIISGSRAGDKVTYNNILNFSGLHSLTTLYGDSGISKILQMRSDTKYVIKSFYSARSIGKHLLEDRFELMEMINSLIDGITGSKFNSKFNVRYGDYSTEDEKNKLYTAIKCDAYCLQEYVSVKHEFRVMYAEGVDEDEYVIEYRTGYSPWAKVKRNHTTKLPESIPTKLINDIRSVCKRFGDSLDIPMCSLDIYVTDNDEIGMFEYSVQFGIEYDRPTLRTLSRQYTNAVLKRLTNQ